MITDEDRIVGKEKLEEEMRREESRAEEKKEKGIRWER